MPRQLAAAFFRPIPFMTLSCRAPGPSVRPIRQVGDSYAALPSSIAIRGALSWANCPCAQACCSRRRSGARSSSAIPAPLHCQATKRAFAISTRSWSRQTRRFPPATARLRRNACAPDYRPPATRTTTRVVVPDAFRNEGNLVARLAGSRPFAPRRTSRRSHRYVEADRADWNRDPFTLVEENGYFYARGAVDDKAMAAAFVDAFVRFREERFRPKRTIKLALTCGEETDHVFDGVRYLLTDQPETLEAGWAVEQGAARVRSTRTASRCRSAFRAARRCIRISS